jgi:hypothetical protein
VLQGLARVQQRAFADKAVATQVDWDAIGELVHSDDGKRELVSLRTTFLDIQSRLTGMTKDTEAPNWAEWSKELDPKIVDGFKKAFESTFYSPFQIKLNSISLATSILLTSSFANITITRLTLCSHEIAFISGR